MSLAYGVVMRIAPVGHEVSKPGGFLYLFKVDFITLYLSFTWGTGRLGDLSQDLCELLYGPLYVLLPNRRACHCADRYVFLMYPLEREGVAHGSLMRLDVE